ncbi:MAG: hypothetical protein WD960_13895 [Gemmatimonadota bacterium]
MHPAFEDVVARSLDDLYAGALYLCVGREEEAEALVTTSLVEASRRYRAERPVDPVFFLETRLVRTLLDGGTGQSASPGADRTYREVTAGAEAMEVFEALAGLTAPIRCTVWLVVVRRRRYGQVAAALRTSREQIAGWVREGHRRMSRSGFSTRLRERYEA